MKTEPSFSVSQTGEQQAGFERFEFLLTRTAIAACAEAAVRVGDHDEFKRRIAFFYTIASRPRPVPSEIVDVRIDDIGHVTLLKVTLLIRRGHWRLAEIARGLEPGDSIRIVREGNELRIDESIMLPLSSLPLSSLRTAPSGDASTGKRGDEVSEQVEVCDTCDGEGEVPFPVCYGGSDHAGHNCHGQVCGSEWAPCPDCEPTPRQTPSLPRQREQERSDENRTRF